MTSAVQHQLAAVHLVLGRDRTEAEIDLVLLTVLDVLRESQLPLSELTSRCNDAWPGADLPASRIETALGAGEAMGLITFLTSFDGADRM